MEFKSIEDLAENFRYEISFERPWLFVIAQDEKKRLEGCSAVKRELELGLEESKSAGKIKEYDVRISDLKGKVPKMDLEFDILWRTIGKNKGKLFIPIFHNADDWSFLPQMAFDDEIPGIFSVSNQGYSRVINSSKRDCYHTLRLN